MSNSVKDERQRRGFVLDMLKGPMSVWVGADVTNAVSSPDVTHNSSAYIHHFDISLLSLLLL